MDTSVPRFDRFKWPKAVPSMSPEQSLIADEFMKYWHNVLPHRFGVIEKFNQLYPLRHLPIADWWRTLELGAGIGAHRPFVSVVRGYCSRR